MILSDVILPSGDKVKRLRKLMGLKQEDLTNGKITRNLISYVENNKTRLTPDTAEIIAEAMNNSGRSKGIVVKAEFLLEDEVSQAERILGGIIEAMENSITKGDILFSEELQRAEAILDEWDIPHRKAKIFELASDWYYNRGQFNESYFYNMKIFESIPYENDSCSRGEVLTRLARCAYWMENYYESIMLNNYALGIIKNKEEDNRYFILYKRACFNKALAYKRLNEQDMCLAELGKLEFKANLLTENERVDIGILKANCYLSKKEYKIALEIYNSLLSGSIENYHIDKVLNIYNNTAVLYKEIQEHEKALECLYKCYKIFEELESVKINLSNKDILFSIARTYIEMNKYDAAEKHLLLLKKINTKEQNLPFLIETYRILCKVYGKMAKDEALTVVVNEVVELFNRHSISEKEKPIIERLLSETAYYFIEKDVAYSKKLLKLGLSIQDNI